MAGQDEPGLLQVPEGRKETLQCPWKCSVVLVLQVLLPEEN